MTARLILLIFVLLAGGDLAGAERAEPLHIGSDKQLFVGPWAADGRDEHLLESMYNVTIRANEARIIDERLVVRDKPWEGERLLGMLLFVLKDNDRFRMYYAAFTKYPKLWQEPNCCILCYAESSDGIHWEKPNLGLVEWEGSRANNIILPNDEFAYTMSEYSGPGVFIDQRAKSPDERYKLIIKITPVRSTPPQKSPMLPKGQYLFASPDGIRWKLMSDKKVNPGASDTQFSIFWDAKLGKYVSYTRVKHQTVSSPKVRGLSDYHRQQYGLKIFAQGRLVGRILSDDLKTWTDETAVFATDEHDHVGIRQGFASVDVEGGKQAADFRGGVDIYGGNVSMYPAAPGVYVGLPTFFYHWKKQDRVIAGQDVDGVSFPGTLDVQFVTSRDGINFHRTPGRTPLLRLGPRGSWYSRMLWPAGSVIRVGDELWIYFSGHDVAHNDEQDLQISHGAVGRAVIRLDGFLSADAAYSGGELTTKPLIFSGRQLQLNVDTSAGGSVRVELLNSRGQPIPGYTLADADEVNGNDVRYPVTWSGESNLEALAGKPVRLRFVMRSAKLFAFQFVGR